MLVRFLGTAASEGIPNPFCNCKICTLAREQGGKNVRSRASVMVDDCIQIDMSPEWSAQLTREGLSARGVHTTLFTHTHPDHFNVGEFVSRCVNFGYNIDSPMYVFGNDCAIKGAFNALDGLGGDRFVLKVVAPFMSFEHMGYTITPILANHARMELCYNYIIQKDGRTFLYGLDSGYLPECSFEFLAKYTIDLAVFECTYADYIEGVKSDNHLNFASLFAQCKRLRDMGVLTEHSKVYASHVSHSSAMTHEEIEQRVKDCCIEVAFDGLKLNV